MSEQKTDNQEAAAAPAAAPAEAPAPKLAAGLFQTFKLGATLEQAAHGNVMHGLKPNMMDYVKRADNHKNEALDPETLEKIGTEEVKKSESNFDKLKNKLANKKDAPKDPAAVAAKVGREKLGEKEMERRAKEGKEKAKKSMDDEIAEVPTEQRELVLAELDRRIDEAKKSNNESEVERLGKAKAKAKEAYDKK